MAAVSKWSGFLSSSAGNRAMIQPALSVTMAHALGQTAFDGFRLPDQHGLPDPRSAGEARRRGPESTAFRNGSSSQWAWKFRRSRVASVVRQNVRCWNYA